MVWPAASRCRRFVSIVVPAYNEELTIVESLRALLALDYQPREIVIVNDGSTDGTLALLQETFQLVPAPLAFDQPLPSAPVRGVYRSVSEPDLVVIDKQNGGCKADAANAGINAASGVLVLVIDADTMLEADALESRRAAVPRRPGDGGGRGQCRASRTAVTSSTAASPTSRCRAAGSRGSRSSSTCARSSCSGSPARRRMPSSSSRVHLGLFRRDAVIAVGGYDRTAIGEDIDLTIRLQRHFRARGEPVRIAFDPNPLCWTQAPEDWQSLRSQRYRWRRGLLQTLWRYRRMIGNPRFGTVGLVPLPYIAFFEGLGPLLEVGGYVVTIVAAALGYLNWKYCGMMIAVSVLFGVAVTLLAVLLNDVTSRRYMRGRDLALLVAVAILESFGYRQLNSLWGCVGTVQALTGKGGWGSMKRQAFRP